MSFRCSECGDGVTPQTGKNRWRQEWKDISVRIPNDFLIETCQGCGEEFSTVEMADDFHIIAVKTLKEVAAKEDVCSLNAELVQLAFRLITSLPKCDECTSPATNAFNRGSGRWCSTHAPKNCPTYPRAEPLLTLIDFLDKYNK